MDIKYYKKIFLTPGIASYKDNGDGVLLIQKETIDKYLDTLKNKDVIINNWGKSKDEYLSQSNREYTYANHNSNDYSILGLGIIGIVISGCILYKRGNENNMR